MIAKVFLEKSALRRVSVRCGPISKGLVPTFA